MSYKRTSPIPVVEGGTGTITNVNHGVLLGAGTSAINNVAVGTTNTVLLAQTGADPIWGAVPNAALANSTITVSGAGGITVSGSPVALGGTVTITGGSGLTYTPVSTTPYVVLGTDEYLGVDSSGGVRQINLPNAPATGRTFTIKDTTGSAVTNNITVTTVGGVVLIDAAATFVMNTNYESIDVIFNGTKYEIF